MQAESSGPAVFSFDVLILDRVAASVPGSRFGRENKSEADRFIRRKSVDATDGIPYCLDMETGHGAPLLEGIGFTMVYTVVSRFSKVYKREVFEVKEVTPRGNVPVTFGANSSDISFTSLDGAKRHMSRVYPNAVFSA